MATRYDLEAVYKWFAGGAKGNQPEYISGTPAKISPDKRVDQQSFGNPHTAKMLARDLPQAMVMGYFDYKDPKYIDPALPHIWNSIFSNVPFATLDGDWFVQEFQISSTNTPIVYELLGDITPQERWNALEQTEKNEIIFEYLLSFEKYPNGTRKTFSHSFYDVRLDDDGAIESEAQQFIEANVQSKINIIYLLLDDDDVVDIYEQDIHNQKIDLDIDYGRLAPIDIIKQKLKSEQQKKTTLAMKEIEDKLAEEGENDLKALFKNLEQCFLLSSVPHFAKFRSDARVATLSGSGAPYGGRIIPIDCDPIENFMNYSSTSGDSYAFTRTLSTSLINAIDFNFIVSNVRKEKIGSNLMEVEMPILFGDQKNILRENQTGSFKHVVLFKKDGNQNKSGSVDLDSILGSNQNLINQISYTDLKIDFIGENQATAKTNVDVSLTLQMPNLTYLQAEFDGVTTVIKPDGTPVNHEYVYSPLDLITYLNRTSINSAVNDISLKKYQGGARLFNPKFFKNYNRLVMKIVPVYNEKGLSAYDKKVLELLKPYLDQNSLILDLALIDHTITRGVKTEGDSKDELKIEYKGYIRSFLQDPICDVLRNKTQLGTLIKAEETLINKIYQMPIAPAAKKLKVVQEIEKHNVKLEESVKAHKTSFKQNIFGALKGNNQIWRIEYTPSRLINFNITKDFEIKDASKIHEFFKKLSPVTTKNIDQESITAKNLTEKSLDLDFIYFGDLVDVLMNNIYKGDPRVDEAIKTIEQMEDNFNNFPLKVLLPSFNPIIYNAGDQAWAASADKINLADFPIAVSWLAEWIDQEIVNSETVFYSLGPFMNNIISSLVNGILVDNCYRNGVASFLQFGIKSDFGTFGGKASSSELNSRLKQENASWFNKLFRVDEDETKPFPAFLKGGALMLNKNDAPFFRKDARLPRSEHCNFLVVYQQIAVFSNYKKLIAKKKYFKDYGIPYFNLLSKTPNGSPNVLTKAMTFNKATANYQRESRFQMESLYSLSQLASVYNVEVETSLLLLDVFPGMIIYTDAGLYQDSTVIGSIANTLGMGGFHLNEKVTHTATISGNKLLAPRTTISANWIYAGADEETDVEATGATPATPATSPAPSTGTPAPGVQPGSLGLVPSIPGVPSMREIIDRQPEPTAESLPESVS
tara:strand:- start:382 stop:3840 length:3459 start_codon:yes stop_codon:yes gene_type:complete